MASIKNNTVDLGRQAKGVLGPSSPILNLNDIIFDPSSGGAKQDFQVELSGAEKELLDQIQAYGNDVAEELAEVRFPYNPVMNDVVWGTVDFRKAGAIYFSRQVGDDVARFQTEKKLEAVNREPTMEPKNAIEAIHEGAKILDGPNGRDKVQDEFLPLIMALADFYRAGGQLGDGPLATLMRWGLHNTWYAKELANILNTSNSVAQEYGGAKAPCLDQLAMNDWFNDVLVAELTRRSIKSKLSDGTVYNFADIDGWLRRKYGLSFFGLPLWLIVVLQNLFPIALGGGVIVAGRKATGEQK